MYVPPIACKYAMFEIQHLTLVLLQFMFVYYILIFLLSFNAELECVSKIVQ